MSLVILARKTGLLLAVTTCLVVLASFSSKPGGEGFEIYLNNKLVLQRYGNEMNTVQNVSLQNAAAGDQLRVRYHHCGKAGKNRQITVRSADNKVLKTWTFKDGDVASSMSCSVSEILSLKKTTTTLKLYYTSSELPEGRQLASLNTAGNVASMATY